MFVNGYLMCVLRGLAAGLLSMVLLLSTGCVTETSSFSQHVDKERFVETSVAAAVRYMQENKTDDAFRHLNRALKVDKRNTSVHNALALLYRMTGDAKLEERHFRLALRYDPKSSQARNNYATFLYREGRYRDALSQLKKATKDPGYAQRELALVNMGRCFLKLDDAEKAMDAFQHAVKVKRELPSAHIELAALYFEQGNWRKANEHIELYGNVARHTPRSLWLGIQLQRILGNRDALASYELALRNLYPDSMEYQLYTESEANKN
jgi:type IV pilus assembly protein PilF